MTLFHAMENFFAVFPRYGKMFSTPWKTSRPSFPLPLLLLAASALSASAQLGPYPVVTKQATFNAEIVKREQDILWVRRQATDGRASPQIGIAVADIVQIQMPRPAAFDAIERLRANPASPDAQIQAGHGVLDRIILQTRPFRDIPGIYTDEAILIKGRLFDRQNLPREAIRQYEYLLANAQFFAVTTNAQILAGIAYANVGEPQFAVEYLGTMPLSEDDEALLSAQLFALGDSYLALGNVDQSLLSYLQLVVFYPYVGDNEPRALAAVLACYAKLGEWEPLYRTIQEIKKNYPDSPAVKIADDMVAKYKDDLVKAGQFVDGEPVVAPAPASTNAPAK